MRESLSFPLAGQIRTKGYPGQMIEYTINEQFLDAELWKLTVNQYRIKPDGGNNGWRGEFWGKLMRAASLTYRATANAKLYAVITESVKDMLTAADSDGRYSTYSRETEFKGWDMWGRKYVMLGFLYYLEICKSKALVSKITKALKKHADYIIKRVGSGKNKVEIYNTSGVYGGMNSCSVLEPFVKLYNLTGEKRYLDFAEYIISTGFTKDQNIIELCKSKTKKPFEFTHTKAYEMTSCFEGLLEYYKIVGNEEHLQTVINFADMVLESDYTVIGCSGCTHELFDDSIVKQTEPSEGVMQETCVTVTFMKLCAKLLAVTGEAKYADVIERSGYNALFGAVNSENQTMAKTEGRVWLEEGMVLAPHEPYPFDSYSPLCYGTRGKVVGGFMVMNDGKTYGCCASIGGAGTAIFGLASIMKGENAYFVNIYNDQTYTEKTDGGQIKIAVKANLYKKGLAKISVQTAEKITLGLRIPAWAKDFGVSVNGNPVEYENKKDYAILSVCGGDCVSVNMPLRVVRNILNGKAEFERGPIVLARDERFGEDMKKPLSVAKKSGGALAKMVKKADFYTNEVVEIKTKEGIITLCDYSSAGKNYDSDNCHVTVWNEIG